MKSSSAQLRAQFFRGNGLNFALALFACLLTAGLNLLIARVLQQMIDAVSGVPGAPGLGRLALLIGLILALIAAAKALEYYAKPRFLERAMRQYKDCAFGLLTQKSLAAFRGEDGAKYLSAFSNDAASVERGCLEGLFSLVSNAVLSLGALAMMLAYSPPMTAVSCAFFALPIAASLAAGDRVERAERAVSDKNGALTASLRAGLALTDKLAAALSGGERDEGGEFRRVSFGYGPGGEVLHDISFSLRPGECAALVGASGSGKSTLLRLLMAAHADYSGEIRLGGRELRELESESLYDLISIIEQEVFVFNASIRDNITMFRAFPEEEVARAIELSGLSALVAERGALALCGENGSALSGGERRRVSIARSLLRRSELLLADEADAALDAATARQVTDSLLSLNGLTRIVVTHDLDAALLRRCDLILALKGGRIVESGSFDELIERRGYFYSLFTLAQQ